MKKVMLINPENPEFLKNKDKSIPIGLLYLSSYIKEYSDVEVKLFDMNIKDYDLIKEIADFEPDFIGIGCLFSGRFNSLLEISKKIKKYYNIPIIIGGLHPTIYARNILMYGRSIDYVCIGEGEETFLRLVNNDDKGCIDGLAYRKDNEIKVNTKINYIENLDDIPFPDYSLINLEDYYFDTSKWHNPKKLSISIPIPIITSRSCPNRCTFCSMFLVHGKKYRTRSPENVVDEIELMVKRYNQRYFSFMDDNFTLFKRRTIDICNEIINRKLNIQFDTPNGISIKTLDEEVMDKLVEAGLVRVCVAPEHASEYIRTLMKKNLTTNEIYNFFDLVKKYKDLKVKAFFIIGYPEESIETLSEIRDMVFNIRDSINQIALFYVIPFPKTELYEKCISLGLINENGNLYNDNFYSNYNDSDNPVIKPFGLELKDLEKFREEMYEIINRKNGDIFIKPNR